MVAWGRSADPDGIDNRIYYQINALKSEDPNTNFPESAWVLAQEVGASGTELNHDIRFHAGIKADANETYIFGIRAIDEMGRISEVAETAPHKMAVFP